jgi:hypothetical protein
MWTRKLIFNQISRCICVLVGHAYVDLLKVGYVLVAWVLHL